MTDSFANDDAVRVPRVGQVPDHIISVTTHVGYLVVTAFERRDRVIRAVPDSWKVLSTITREPILKRRGSRGLEVCRVTSEDLALFRDVGVEVGSRDLVVCDRFGVSGMLIRVYRSPSWIRRRLALTRFQRYAPRLSFYHHVRAMVRRSLWKGAISAIFPLLGRSDQLLKIHLDFLYWQHLKVRTLESLSEFTVLDRVECAILFLDICDYTRMCYENSDGTLHKLLQFYRELDALILDHGLEKIEVIGDCYMVASYEGRSSPRPDALGSIRRNNGSEPLVGTVANRVTEFALEAIEAANRVSINVRVGIAYGPATSGIVGAYRPRFFLYGDTVNTASRLQSQSTVNGVMVSDEVYDRLGSELSEASEWISSVVYVKGKGYTRVHQYATALSDVDIPECLAEHASLPSMDVFLRILKRLNQSASSLQFHENVMFVLGLLSRGRTVVAGSKNARAVSEILVAFAILQDERTGFVTARDAVRRSGAEGAFSLSAAESHAQRFRKFATEWRTTTRPVLSADLSAAAAVVLLSDFHGTLSTPKMECSKEISDIIGTLLYRAKDVLGEDVVTDLGYGSRFFHGDSTRDHRTSVDGISSP